MSAPYTEHDPSFAGGLAVEQRPAAVPAVPIRRWTPGRVASMLCGLVAAGLSAVLLLAGAVGLAADTAGRDADGFLTGNKVTVATDGYALTSDDLEVDLGPGVSYPRSVLGDVRIRVTGVDPQVPVFVGMARSADVERYLAGVRHTVVTDAGDFGDVDPGTVTRSGSAVPTSPQAQPFWTARAIGTGNQSLTWTPEDGTWTVVVMRADARPGLAVRADTGIDAPILTGVAVALLVGGTGMLLLASTLVLVPVVRALRTARP